MNRIQALTPSLIAQIAAGEVIERPAYVVKELVENAIDAQATSITIEILESGLTSILVRDDGIGMALEDLVLAPLRYTTSKVDPTSETLAISHFGFRGEALFSIASVSQLTIASRPIESSTGQQIQSVYGELASPTPIGMPVGTAITVEDLFSNTPARKKFLKSAASEFRLISEVIIRFILAHPTIQFRLLHNKKEILRTYQHMSETERLSLAFGDSEAQLFALEDQSGMVTLTGRLGSPQASRSSSDKLLFFVNNRPVQDKLLLTAVKDAYASLLDPTRFPIGYLSLTIPNEYVDVNVHPRKEQVAFRDAPSVFDAVLHAVEHTLASQNLTFANLNWKRSTLKQVRQTSLRSNTQTTPMSRILKETTAPWDIRTKKQPVEIAPIQFHNTFILTQTKRGFSMFDQHAVHERILYEQFKQALLDTDATTPQELSTPINLHLDISSHQQWLEHREVVTKLGFTIQEGKNTTLHITHAPLLFVGRNIEDMFHDLLTNLTTHPHRHTMDRVTHIMLSFLACKQAVKAGEPLTSEQCQELITKLATTAQNATCPHGRPTTVDVSLQELYSLFKRT